MCFPIKIAYGPFHEDSACQQFVLRSMERVRNKQRLRIATWAMAFSKIQGPLKGCAERCRAPETCIIQVYTCQIMTELGRKEHVKQRGFSFWRNEKPAVCSWKTTASQIPAIQTSCLISDVCLMLFHLFPRLLSKNNSRDRSLRQVARVTFEDSAECIRCPVSEVPISVMLTLPEAFSPFSWGGARFLARFEGLLLKIVKIKLQKSTHTQTQKQRVFWKSICCGCLVLACHCNIIKWGQRTIFFQKELCASDM